MKFKKFLKRAFGKDKWTTWGSLISVAGTVALASGHPAVAAAFLGVGQVLTGANAADSKDETGATIGAAK